MKPYVSFVILMVTLTSVAYAQAPPGGIGQRQGGPRGPGGFGQRQGPATLETSSELQASRAVTLEPVTSYAITTAWWTNAALLTRLGLTDAQKSRIESTFEAHRQNLISSKEQLEKEEALLAKMLEADSLDRNGAFTQINRVIQARGEMERINAGMTLEMREQLTRAQWTDLQASQPRMLIRTNSGDPALPLQVRPVRPGLEIAPPAGTRGGARGGGNVQQ